MSDIIYTPPVSSGGGVNPTSTYMPVNIGGTFVDSICQSVPNTFWQTINGGIGFGFSTSLGTGENYIGDFNNLIDGKFLKVQNDTITSRIFTSNSGFYLDFNVRQYRFGDYNNAYNGTNLFIDDITELIFTKNNNISTGLSCDFNIRQFLFGSYGSGSLTYLSIEDTQQRIYTNYNGSIRGFFLDFFNNEYFYGDYANATYFKFSANNVLQTFFATTPNGLELLNNQFIYTLGDYSGLANAISLQIDSQNPKVSTFFFGSENLFKVEGSPTKLAALLGDYNNVVNGTHLKITDNVKLIQLLTNTGTIEFNSDLLDFNGNILTGSSSGFSGDHLQVTINGTQYVIRLENP
jgi:hypothetical protein